TLNTLSKEIPKMKDFQYSVYRLFLAEYLLILHNIQDSLDILEEIDETILSARWKAYRYFVLFKINCFHYKDESSVDLINSAINLSSIDGGLIKLTKYTHVKAKFYHSIYDIELAKKLYIEAARNYLRIQLFDNAAMVFNDLACAYRFLGLLKEAKRYHSIGLEYSTKNYCTGIIFNELSKTSLLLNEINFAHTYITGSVYYLKTENLFAYANVLNQYAVVEVHLDNIEHAITLLLDSLQIKQGYKFKDTARTKAMIGFLRIYNNEIEIAKEYLEQALNLYEQDHNKSQIKRINHIMSIYLVENNKLEKEELLVFLDHFLPCYF
ncbi:MAG: tetratricopeptide repeat protein, partial [Candidatus Heimdallarchaeota archaeon]|nr:tetratricopeptide repeat protein [Candidatus Heimdallarchaeota archaeon]